MTLREALLRGRRRPHRFGAGSPTMYRGDGYEFVELRAYVAGDDVRRIDWAATARAGELQTRVVLEDVALTVAAIVDDSPSMRIGRKRPLADAAGEAAQTWYGVATSGDRCLQIGADAVAERHGSISTTFELRAALRTAYAALPRGTALLAVSDWYDLGPDDDALLMQLGARFDCTALVARDPWHDGLPLHGFVRIRGAEGGHLRAYIGRRERERFARAVRERESALRARFERAAWRTGVLRESSGSASVFEAFGIHTERIR